MIYPTDAINDQVITT